MKGADKAAKKQLAKEMLKSVGKALSFNMGWKIFSVIFAFCVWFVVINITNPKEVWSFSMTPTLSGLEALTERQDVVVRNQRTLEGTIVTVQVRGNRLDLEELNKNRNQIEAQVKLGVIYDFTLEGDVEAPIDIIFPTLEGISSDAFQVIAKSPEYAKVTLEEIAEIKKPVTISTLGSVAEGYVALTPEITPDTVTLRGPRSRLNQIDQVEVEAVLSGETSDINLLLGVKLLDRDMNPVSDVEADTELIDVKIKVDRHKRVPVFASYIGEPPPGYAITTFTWEPANLEIVGKDEDVEAFREIRLMPVNVSGLTETNTTPFDVRSQNILPETISIRNGTPNNINVTAVIERVVEKEFAAPVSMLNTETLSSSYSYNILDSTIRFTVTGTESAIARFEGTWLDNVRLSISLQEFEAGERNVPVKLELPEGIKLSRGNPTVRVNVAEVRSEDDENSDIDEDSNDASEALSDEDVLE